MSPSEVPGDVEEFLKEQPLYLHDIYRMCCEDYDKAQSKSGKEKVFSDRVLDNKCVFNWGMWMDYWFFL